MRNRWTWIVLGLLCACVAAGVNAASKFWRLAGVDSFTTGELDGVSVLSTGEMVLGPAAEQITGLDANYVWDIAPAEGQQRAYVATGSPASVYVLEEEGLRLLHKTSEAHVQSVLPLPDGEVLAASAPRGIIYRIDAEGEVSIFADLDENYIWDMEAGENGHIYCATGPNGRLIGLNPTGEAEVLYDAEQSNLLCLARDAEEGTIYAGTDGAGLIYSITPQGKAQVLYDAEENEVHRLLEDDGVLYCCTAQTEVQGPNRGQRKNGQNGQPQPPPTNPGKGARALPGAPKAPNSVYRIVPGEGATRLTQMSGALILSLARGPDGEVLAGTGAKARVIGATPDGVTRLVTELKAEHVSAMAEGPEGAVLLGTSNGGTLWRLGGGYRHHGTYISEVFDASYLSRWGRVSWRGDLPAGTGWEVSFRTGNSRQVDETWSDWSAPSGRHRGVALRQPMGRFARVRIELTTDDPALTPVVRGLVASYRQSNRRPQIQDAGVNGDGGQRGASPQRRGAGEKQKTARKVVLWQVVDPNGDTTVVDLHYRGVGQKEWKELARGIRKESKFEWDTQRVPDGRYDLRVRASDGPDRSAREALTAEQILPPVVIDNTRPRVENLKAVRTEEGNYRITGTATDRLSHIAAMEVSRNAGDWRPVFGQDEMFDSPSEEFLWQSEELAPGEHVFVFTATDASGNVGSNKVVVVVEEGEGERAD